MRYVSCGCFLTVGCEEETAHDMNQNKGWKQLEHQISQLLLRIFKVVGAMSSQKIMNKICYKIKLEVELY